MAPSGKNNIYIYISHLFKLSKLGTFLHIIGFKITLHSMQYTSIPFQKQPHTPLEHILDRLIDFIDHLSRKSLTTHILTACAASIA